ncbi:Protein TolB [Arsenophonus endosymbiont of Aleurodicus floccissimus]|uniref:Tol-Pal system beta propeller repeat protein TolB n=1 Tax=Arsenophonus endosymbiont of Aleurodicus floccissimus TaxID=2152761 RepID=UPI000E6B393F|nr:Tol-Pal system beta propeller repeat protein TolB [Arsenophonus endosymbiont of Aleurodicus floccissimus]SPP30963.1 Protein TolB [Arsenophonus endosymbiont of Aleurodicus floccissimus]
MKQAFKLLLSFLILWAACAQAEIQIEITQGINTAQPIAIVPFKWTGAGTLPDDVGQIVAADLRNSGKFNPIDPSHMPQQPTTASEITPNVWTGLGINAVVVGQVQPAADGQYIINYQLVDVVNSPGAILTQNQLKVAAKWLRYAAHTISDEVFAKLTRIRGAFHTRIAYVVKTNGGKFPYELRVSDYDGYNQFTVHRSPEPLMSPAWSADGEKLVYVTFESGSSALVMQTLVTGEVRQIAAFPRHNGAPTFSPDGSKLAFALSKSGSLNLYVMDLASGQTRQITDGRSNNTEPSWMPDSQTLIYTSDQAGRPQIYKLNINGGVPERITWEGNQNQDPSVSPDGKFMVMVNSSNGKQHIAKQDLATGNVEYLTDTFLDETPSIAPNGTMVIYSVSQGLGTVLHLVSTDGRFKARLPATDGKVKFPAWSPYL